MKVKPRSVGRDVVFNGEPKPVIDEGEFFVELPDIRLKWGLRELVRDWVVPSNMVKNGPGVIPQTIFYTGCQIEEITWDFNEDPRSRCVIKMSDGSIAKYPPPRLEDVSLKQILKASLEAKTSAGRPGQRAAHKPEAIERACAWIYKLHVQDGQHQIPAAKAAIKKHHLRIGSGWLLQRYREHKPTYWAKKLDELQTS